MTIPFFGGMTLHCVCFIHPFTHPFYAVQAVNVTAPPPTKATHPCYHLAQLRQPIYLHLCIPRCILQTGKNTRPFHSFMPASPTDSRRETWACRVPRVRCASASSSASSPLPLTLFPLPLTLPRPRLPIPNTSVLGQLVCILHGVGGTRRVQDEEQTRPPASSRLISSISSIVHRLSSPCPYNSAIRPPVFRSTQP